ncbi:MAG: protein kinase, partial [Bryobacteraceae bacterium]
TNPGPTEATLTKALTTEGTVLGTPQYMAPEQFEGKEAGLRSDIWAFGAVLYEMVTGRKAFEGKTYTSLVGAILSADPAAMALKPFTPAWLERLVQRCLQKDPEDRWQSMRDIVLELKLPPADAAAPPTKTSRWPWAFAATLGVGLVAAIVTRPSPPQLASPLEFDIVPEGGGLVREVKVSPDGKTLAYQAGAPGRIWLRPLNSTQARMVDDIANLTATITWSPDSSGIVYRASGGIKKLEAGGATGQVIVPGITPNSIAWGERNWLYFHLTGNPIQKVPVTGGPPVVALKLDEEGGEVEQRYPEPLPDGKHILYASIRKDASQSGIYMARLDGNGKPRRVHRFAREFDFVEPQTLLLPHNGGVYAFPFDSESGMQGDPAVISAGAGPALSSGLGASASLDGRVIATINGAGEIRQQVSVYDRTGKRLRTLEKAAPPLGAHLEISPDGETILLEQLSGNRDLWTFDLTRGTASRLTFHSANEAPASWSADGRRVYFFSNRPETGPAIYEIPSNGAGGEKLVAEFPSHHVTASPDGQYLMFENGDTATNQLWTLDLKNGNKAAPYLDQKNLTSPQFSPDGKLVAYESVETGQQEIYVQTFPAGGGKWQISTGGGIEPRWRGDGKEIFYDGGGGTVMAAGVEIRAGSLVVTEAKELFRFTRLSNAGTAIAVSADGQRFVICEVADGQRGSPIRVKVNWPLETPAR